MVNFMHEKEDTVTMGSVTPLLPEGVTLTPFAPVAYYDTHMDCIRVMVSDRSVTEERLDESLTLYRTNHRRPFDREHSGFCLKGVAHLFDDIGLEIGSVATLTEIIDAVAKSRPHSLMSKILSDFAAEQSDIALDWAEAA